MELPKAAEFNDVRRKPISLAAALKLARSELRAVSDRPVDTVTRCDRLADDGWLVTLDVIESPARMGENDLLSRFEMRMDPDGTVAGFAHLGRYRREDGFPT